MSLDLFQQDEREAVAGASRSMAPELPATFGDAFLPAWRDGLLFGQSVSRSQARLEAMDDFIGQVYRLTGQSLPNPEFGGNSLDEFNNLLEPLAQRYPQLGRQRLDEPDAPFRPFTEDDIEKLAVDWGKKARIDYQTFLRRERTFGGGAGVLAGQAAAGITDPINLLAFPLAAPSSLGIIGTTLAWGGIAGATQAAIEVAGYDYRKQVDPTYGGGEALNNVLGAAAFGGALGGGIKGIGSAWTRVKTGEWPRTIRDAGNVVESEAQIAQTNVLPGPEGEAAHRTAMQRKIDQLVTGRPQDVDDVLTPSLLAGYEQRLAPVMEARQAAVTAGERGIALEREAARLPPTMERLSEVQLDQVRRAAARIEDDALAAQTALQRQGEALTAERAALENRRAGLAGRQDEIGGIEADLADRRQRLSQARPPTDELTQQRLAAIEQELQRPNLGGDARALLEGERASITETLAKTSPADKKLIASLTQEVKGLERALARAQKGVAREQAALTKGATRAAATERRIATTGDLTAQRLASQREAMRREAERSVRALASEGYGLRLPADDIAAMADRLLKASDAEADDVLRGISDSLIRQREAAITARGPQTVAGQRQGRVAEYWTEQARKRVTALAREVGYVMPREEAAAIAARIIASKTDDEALAILDELMLRPRTLADSLPGTISRETPTAQGEPPSPFVRAQEAALMPEVTPAAAAKARVAPETADAVLNDLDRLRASKERVEYPDGVDANGQAVMRSVDDVIDDADARIKAAQEIAACAVPPQQEAA